MDKVFIFGFGSLINSQARGATVSESQAYPVRVCGLKRFWNGHEQSALGVIKESGSICNGVLFEILAEDLPSLDKREFKFRRISVDSCEVEFLNDRPESVSTIWTYEPLNIVRPNAECKIFQSYIDVIISGCLEISEAFAIEFITSTHRWSEFVVNDRGNEQYERHLKETDTSKIDALLEKYQL